MQFHAEISGIHILHEIGMSYWIRFAIKKTINIKTVDIVSESLMNFNSLSGQEWLNVKIAAISNPFPASSRQTLSG